MGKAILGALMKILEKNPELVEELVDWLVTALIKEIKAKRAADEK